MNPVRENLNKYPEQNFIGLQGFTWQSYSTAHHWDKLLKLIPIISATGFDRIWLPPSAKAADAQGYLPNEYYNQNSRYGSQQQLKALTSLCYQLGVLPIADVVINHRVGTKGWADFTNPYMGPDAVCSTDEWSGAKGNPDTGINYHAARDLDHTNPDVQLRINQYLKWLRNEIGYAGFRYDYARGFSGHYIKTYNVAGEPEFSVGEFWEPFSPDEPDVHRQRLCDWLDSHEGSSCAFDFTTKGLLHAALERNDFRYLMDAHNKPAGLIGWWPERSVTFVGNHDTSPSSLEGLGYWPFPNNKRLLGYCYILTHPGIPFVYLADYLGPHADTINKLIALRISNKIRPNSVIELDVVCSDCYVARVNTNLLVKLGKALYQPDQCWKLALEAEDVAIWLRKDACGINAQSVITYH